MSARVRHQSPPNPNGCRWCGEDPSHHGRSYVRSVGMHGWEAPTRAQRLARMLARRKQRP